ncbi:MAG: adenylate/guanylate cyclase domain-containing protein [Leptospiraceae bacterium]|nr:adenylate/guanylate cyclase domain-containing protein [Leptospiraceae bacterium]
MLFEKGEKGDSIYIVCEGELDCCFTQFDKIMERYNLEKLKTIGDSYMYAGGIPKVSSGVKSAIDIILAAIEIQAYMNQVKEIRESQGLPYWELRLGIHSGPLVAGVIGERKFAYDVWGDSVNTASRMESSGTPGKINVNGIRPDLCNENLVSNDKFWELYNRL